MTIIKALSIRQPWAWACAIGFKAVENRTRNFNYRGRIAIHASKDHRDCIDPYVIDELYQHRQIFDAADLKDFSCDRPQLNFGAIIGAVDIIDCLPFDESQDFDAIAEAANLSQWLARRDPPAGAFATGPFCLIFDNPKLYPLPIPATGALGLWSMPDSIAEAVAEADRRPGLRPGELPPRLPFKIALQTNIKENRQLVEKAYQR